ncbi:MAG: metallophosphoesterase [Clostridia bacterium]|nr:metallophosphoesterase [Clostridia bacterium]
MKVFAISDLHLSTTVNKPMDVFGGSWDDYLELIMEDWNEKVADDDVVLLCGDFSWAMRQDEVKSDFELISKLKGTKVILRGNHDYWWNTYSQVKSLLPNGFYALQNNCLRFGKLLLCGTRGWVVPQNTKLLPEDEKIYKRELERLSLSLADMQKQRKEDDVVVAMMHFPPFNAKYEASEFVTKFVENDVKKVVYGHLHGKDCRAELQVDRYGITFYLTSCDLAKNKLALIAEI